MVTGYSCTFASPARKRRPQRKVPTPPLHIHHLAHHILPLEADIRIIIPPLVPLHQDQLDQELLLQLLPILTLAHTRLLFMRAAQIPSLSILLLLLCLERLLLQNHHLLIQDLLRRQTSLNPIHTMAPPEMASVLDPEAGLTSPSDNGKNSCVFYSCFIFSLRATLCPRKISGQS